MSEILKTNVVVADLDLAFGTTGLDFNQDPVQGIAEALQSPERLDEVLLDRLLTKCSERLSIFAAPVVLDRDYDISADACDIVLDIVRQNVPFVAVDLPHTWTPWVKRVLLQADEIVITAVPDLANLRNAKNLIDLLKQNRTNDGPPHLVINMAKTPKRPEISVKEFAVALDLTPTQVIEFDSETFGLASNNGQMIEEFSAKAKAAPSSSASWRSRWRTARSRRRRRRSRALASRRCSRNSSSSAEEPDTMFGRRSQRAVGTAPAAARRRRRRRSRPSPPRPRSRAHRAARAGRGPSRSVAGAAALGRVLRRQDDGLQRADRHHRPDAARQARGGRGARGDPRHRQRDHPDQERRDVDRRAGGAARGHLQRRAGLRPARAAAGARRHRRHHGQRRQHHLHRGRRQGAEDRRALRRQRAADEHLPAHRQPGRPPRRRIEPDLRRAPSRRQPRQRHRPAAGHRRARRSPSASSRRTA